MSEYALKGFADILIVNYQTGEPVIFLPEALFSNIIEDGSKYTDSAGGERGLSLLGWNVSPDMKFAVQVPYFSPKFIELASGGKMGIDSNVHAIERIEVNNNELELSHTPNNLNKYVYQLNKSGKTLLNNVVDYTIEDNVITLTQENMSGYFLIFYFYNISINYINIEFKDKPFFTVYGKASLYNEVDSVETELKFIIPKVQIENIFDLKMLNSPASPGTRYTLLCHALREDNALMKLYVDEIEDD